MRSKPSATHHSASLRSAYPERAAGESKDTRVRLVSWRDPGLVIVILCAVGLVWTVATSCSLIRLLSPEPVPQPRPVELPHGVEQLLVTSSVLALTVVIGRYVFRLRL